jgi:hypothetical protein
MHHIGTKGITEELESGTGGIVHFNKDTETNEPASQHQR